MPKVVVGTIIEKDGKILILQRSKKEKAFPEMWDLPGGELDHGENIIDCVKREVKEESGLDVEVLFPVDVFSKVIDDEHYVSIVYVSNHRSGDVKLSKEHQTFKWINPNKAIELEDLTPSTEHALYAYIDFISV